MTTNPNASLLLHEPETVYVAAKHFLWAIDRGHVTCQSSEYVDALRASVERADTGSLKVRKITGANGALGEVENV